MSADLDFKPYRDEHDDALVQRMLDCILRGVSPAKVDAERAKRAIVRHMPTFELAPSTKKRSK